MMTAILAFSGLIVAAINYEIDKASRYHSRDPLKYPNAMDDPTNAQPYTNFIRMITLLTTILAAACLSKRHYYKSKWKSDHFFDDKGTRMYYKFHEVLMECDTFG